MTSEYPKKALPQKNLYYRESGIGASVAEVLSAEVSKYGIPDSVIQTCPQNNKFIQQKMQGKRKIY